MTHAERALLMAVANRMTLEVRGATTLRPLIAAVEAESAPEPPAEDKSCETCRFSEGEGCTAGPGYCLSPSLKMWQPKALVAALIAQEKTDEA